MTPDTPTDLRLLRLAAVAVEEAEALLAVLPAALAARLDRSLASRGVPDETGRRPVGGHSDPTAETATDPHRLHLSTVLDRSAPHLADAAVRIRGVRRALDRAMDRWAGAGHDEIPQQ